VLNDDLCSGGRPTCPEMLLESSSSRPRRRVTVASNPRNSRASVGLLIERRTSPARTGAYCQLNQNSKKILD
jgi:hypothetical protein